MIAQMVALLRRHPQVPLPPVHLDVTGPDALMRR